MIGRVILAALLAGIAAGLVMGVIQHARLTPLILEAETYETADHVHDRAGPVAGVGQDSRQTAPDSHEQDETDAWLPANGWQRTAFTTINWALAGAGFAGLLAGISLLTGLPITRANGMIWGLCGFLAVAIAPAAGLSPELPGMPTADLVTRQIWWAGTIAATGAALYLIATRRELWAMVLAIVLIGLPHIIGAPVAEMQESKVPAELAATFVANSIAANAVFWALLGLFLGLAYDRYARDIYST